MEVHSFMFSFSTEYYQFYILDSKTKAKTDADDFWCPDADKRRLAIGEGLLGVTTTTYGDVIGGLRLLLKKPENLLIDAKHIIEASIKIPSGVLQIKNCTAYETKLELPVEKGTYRIRITTQSCVHVTDKVEENEDHYIIEMWKSNFAKPQILKAYNS